MRRTIMLLPLIIGMMPNLGAQVTQSGPGHFVCTPCNRKCDDIDFDKPGICPHCNMKLIKKTDLKDYPESKRVKVGFYLQSGVEILDLAGPLEVFSYAGYEVFTISKTRAPIYAQGILTVIPDYDITEAPEAEILVFFGGNAVLPSKDRALIEWVRSRKNTEYYFSVCSGALILAEAGILDGHAATTFRNNLDNLEKNYPEVTVLRGVRYVDNGKVITTAGVSAGIDGALHMVAKLNGLGVAGEVAYYMEYDKWVPNQGVVLSDDNPYKSMKDLSVLSEYTGGFKLDGGHLISIQLSEQENELFIEIKNKTYPIFYMGQDKFLTSHASHFMTFKRNNKNEVIGFETSEYPGFFHKL